MRVSRTTFACSMVLLTTGLCGSGPPPKGVETRFMAGSGGFEYQSGGCGGPTYANRATEGSAFAAATYRHETGITGVAEVSAAVAKTRSSRLIDPGDDPIAEVPPQDEDELGRVQYQLSVSPRLGYHHKYFGLEAGAFFLDDIDGGEPAVLPSGQLWAGHPDYVYLWGAFLAGPSSLGHLPAEAGIGHASERWRGALGVGWEPSILAEGSLRVDPDLPFYLGARFTQIVGDDRKGTLAAATVAYTW